MQTITTLYPYRITAAQAVEKVRTLAIKYGAQIVGCEEPLGMTAGSFDTSAFVIIRREREEVTVSLSLNANIVRVRVSGAAAKEEMAKLWTLETSVSWSATGRSIARATAALALYADAVRLASQVASAMEEEQILETEADMARADEQRAVAREAAGVRS